MTRWETAIARVIEMVKMITVETSLLIPLTSIQHRYILPRVIKC